MENKACEKCGVEESGDMYRIGDRELCASCTRCELLRIVLEADSHKLQDLCVMVSI